MKILIPSVLSGLAAVHLLLPQWAPDISLFYLLPVLAWGRCRWLPWTALTGASLLTSGLHSTVLLLRGEVLPGSPAFSSGFFLNALGCLGAVMLVSRRKPAPTGERERQTAVPQDLTDTEWTPSTRPAALFKFDEPGGGEPSMTVPEAKEEDSTSRFLSMKHAQAALLRSEARMQFALEGSNTGVWEWDIVTNRNYYSTVWHTMLGYAPGEIANTQEAWVNITHPDDVPVCEASIRRHLSGEAPVHKAEHRLRAKDGSWRWILTQGKILQRDGEGRPLRMFGTHTDITGTKKLTAELSSEKNRLELATRAGNFGVWESDFVTGRLTWDQRMHGLFGVPEQKFGGMEADWTRALHPDDRPGALEQWAVILSDPAATAYEAEFRILHGITGEIRHMRANGILIRDHESIPVRAIGLNWDVTEERLASATLLKAKEAAEAGEKARSDFMASMSHELRTPMNGILGMAELLLDSSLSPAQTEMVSVMHRSGENLLHIINDILDFSRLEAGRMRMRAAPFLLHEILRDTLRLLELKAARRHITLEWTIGLGLDQPLLGDGGRIRQIITNLISNAIKFTEDGGVSLFLRRLENDSGEDGGGGKQAADGQAGGDRNRIRFRIEVRDTGIGIPARHHEKLFAPFRQVDQSSHRRFGGTGLGLTISSQIAAAMGSRIRFESEENKGSTFWLDLTLPRSAEETVFSPEPDDGAQTASGPLTAGGGDFRSLHLLLVEDHEANQRVATLLLEQFGHKVRVAHNGLMALEMLRGNTYDLVLMDCRMPIMDGFETTRRIRAGEVSPQNHGIPIIALTASGMPGDHERCLDIGMNGYALKPINRRELAHSFRECGLKLTALPLSSPLSGSQAPAAMNQSGDTADLPVLDSARMDTLRHLPAPDGGSLLVLCARMLLEEAPSRLLSLGEAMSARNFEGIIDASHHIAGGCANLGATALYSLMGSLEMAARSGAEEILEQDFLRVEGEWNRLETVLTRLLQSSAIETPADKKRG